MNEEQNREFRNRLKRRRDLWNTGGCVNWHIILEGHSAIFSKLERHISLEHRSPISVPVEGRR